MSKGFVIIDAKGPPYRPTKWVFVEVRDAEKGEAK
jgi:hypothetical protein